MGRPSAIGRRLVIDTELVHGLKTLSGLLSPANMRCAAFLRRDPIQIEYYVPGGFRKLMPDICRTWPLSIVFAISRFSFDDLRQFLL
jgi:hypothetical protein